MSAQTAYRFSTPIGVAGGLVDIAPKAIDTLVNEENTGVMLFGIGVVQGTTKGRTVKKPTNAATAATFEGITVNGLTTEYTMEGKISIRKGVGIGIMRYGRIYGRVATGATPAYGDPIYMVKTGDEAGYFTNASEGALAVKGRFLGSVDSSNQIAPIELFNQAQA